MAYDEVLANRIRAALQGRDDVEDCAGDVGGELTEESRLVPAYFVPLVGRYGLPEG